MSVFQRVRFAALLLAAPCLMVGSLEAKPPEVRSVNLRGLQIGATTVVTIDGVDLMPAPRIYLNEHLLNSTLDPASSPGRVILSIATPETILPGFGQLRIATEEGFSSPVLVGLDRLPNVTLTDEIAAVPVAIHGSVPGSGTIKTRFTAKAGEELIVETESRRLGSKLRPVLHVYDEQRIQVAWAMPSHTLSGDCRTRFQVPRDGRYTLELHDSQYAPPGPSYYRLKVGQWQYADLAFPPAIALGQDSAVELLGNVGVPRVSMKPTTDVEFIPVPLPNVTGSSGAAPMVSISSLPELIEVNASESPLNLPSFPVAVSGRLITTGERDRFLLPVTAGAKLTLEVFAERIGSRVDTFLELKNQAGALLASNDDAASTTDSKLDFVVPAATEIIEIVARDTLEVANAEAIYRLVITPTDAPKNDFQLSLKTDVVNVPLGENQVLEALVSRQGYQGPLQLETTGLPPGITVSGTDIPAGANGTLLVFSGGGDSVAGLVTQIRAKSPDGSLVRFGSVQTVPNDLTPVWMRDQIGLAVSPRSATSFQVTWANPDAVPQLPMASKQVLALNITRPPSMYGPVRLSLVSSQPVPTPNGQPNVALSLRAEQVVEVPVDPPVKVAGDALVATEKLATETMKAVQAAQGDAKIAAETKLQEVLKQRTSAESALRDAEAKAKYGAQLSLVVPASISEPVCDLAVKAELLNPERNTVLRTTYTPVRRLPVLNPLVIELAGGAILETTLDAKAGATVKVAANIKRLAGYGGAITVALTGLPAGATAANVTVNADQTQFTIDLKLPANFAPTEIQGLKLTATGPADPLSGNVPVKSAEVELMVKINR